MAIEAILFDLGKVLVDFDIDPMLARLTACSGKPDEFRRVFFDTNLAYRYESGAMTTQQFYEHLCRFGGLRMGADAFRSTWTSMFHPGLLVSENLLAGLRRRYPLILVSNTNEAHVEFIAERYSVFDYFDHKIFSFEVGSMKPDALIFKRAIAVSGKNAESLFFVDDREENVRGACAVGIHSHQFRSEQDLTAALQAAGVAF